MIAVGQKLWFVPREMRSPLAPGYWTVESVGRRWIYFQDKRYRADKDNSPGQGHVSREAFEAERERMRAWHYLRVRLSDMSRPGASVTLEDIHAAEVLLGLQNGGQHG
mgnify:CR=1 FL=1